MLKKLPGRRWMSLWRHFYDREKTAEQLTETMIEWQEKWNWDLLKLNPAACYHVLDWGAEYEFHNDSLMEPTLVKPVIVNENDFNRVGRIDVNRGTLGDQLNVIRNLRNHFGPNLPIVETVFSPPEIAHRLMNGRESLREFMRSSPRAVHALLKTITNTFEEFCLACLEAGASGIFFATKWANSDSMSWEEFQEFERPYDLQILNRLAEREALIVLHVCGPNTYLERMLDYPSDIISYDFHAKGNCSPSQIVAGSGKFVMGGIDPERLKTQLESVIEDCIRYTSIPEWMAGPSCVVLPDTPDSIVGAVKDRLWPLL